MFLYQPHPMTDSPVLVLITSSLSVYSPYSSSITLLLFHSRFKTNVFYKPFLPSIDFPPSGMPPWTVTPTILLSNSVSAFYIFILIFYFWYYVVDQYGSLSTFECTSIYCIISCFYSAI